MKLTPAPLACLLILGACSSGQRVTYAGMCDGIGLVPGGNAYAQCREDSEIRKLANQRSLLHDAANMPSPMLVQQTNRPLSPLINCTSFSNPGSATICG